MIDVENLDKFIVIPTGSADPGTIDDLRELEGDYPTGVYALWSDEQQTIVAFAFDPLRFDEEGARAWIADNIVAQATTEKFPHYVAQGVRAALDAIMSAAASAFDVKAVTIDDRYYVPSGRGVAIASDEEKAWDWTTAKQDAVLEAEGWPGYARAHLVADLERAEEGQRWPEVKDAYTYPVAEMIDGKLSFVLRAAQAVYANLRGGRAAPDLPVEVKEAVLESVKRIYRRFGREADDMSLRGFDEIRRLVQAELDRIYITPLPGALCYKSVWIQEMGDNEVVFEFDGRTYSASYEIDDDNVVAIGEPVQVSQEWVRPDGSTIMLYALSARMGDGDDAEGNDGLVWKEIVRPGTWYKTDTGREVEITAEIIQEAYRAWENRLPQYISVAVKSHYDYTGGIVPPDENSGFVDKLKLVSDRLFGGFRFTDWMIERKVDDGSIADCSVYLRGNVHHPESGELFPWTLQHVLLTNDPLVQKLEPFGTVPASALAATGGSESPEHRVILLQEAKMSGDKKKDKGVDQVGVIQLSAEDLAEFERYRALGSVDQVQAVVAQREDLAARGRALTVSQVVAALEGTVEHDGIVQVEGRRHYPVVVAAAERALKSVPIADVMAAGDDGLPVDRLVVDILNALPAEARLQIPPAPATPKAPKDTDGSIRGEDGEIKADAVTDEHIDALDRQLSGAAATVKE